MSWNLTWRKVIRKHRIKSSFNIAKYDDDKTTLKNNDDGCRNDHDFHRKFEEDTYEEESEEEKRGWIEVTSVLDARDINATSLSQRSLAK